MITPSYFPVKRALHRGAKCPISGVEFVLLNPTKSELEGLITQSLAYTAAIMADQDGPEPKYRGLVDRQNLYRNTQN